MRDGPGNPNTSEGGRRDRPERPPARLGFEVTRHETLREETRTEIIARVTREVCDNIDKSTSLGRDKNIAKLDTLATAVAESRDSELAEQPVTSFADIVTASAQKATKFMVALSEGGSSDDTQPALQGVHDFINRIALPMGDRITIVCKALQSKDDRQQAMDLKWAEEDYAQALDDHMFGLDQPPRRPAPVRMIEGEPTSRWQVAANNFAALAAMLKGQTKHAAKIAHNLVSTSASSLSSFDSIVLSAIVARHHPDEGTRQREVQSLRARFNKMPVDKQVQVERAENWLLGAAAERPSPEQRAANRRAVED